MPVGRHLLVLVRQDLSRQQGNGNRREAGESGAAVWNGSSWHRRASKAATPAAAASAHRCEADLAQHAGCQPHAVWQRDATARAARRHSRERLLLLRRVARGREQNHALERAVAVLVHKRASSNLGARAACTSAWRRLRRRRVASAQVAVWRAGGARQSCQPSTHTGLRGHAAAAANMHACMHACDTGRQSHAQRPRASPVRGGAGARAPAAAAAAAARPPGAPAGPCAPAPPSSHPWLPGTAAAAAC